MSSMLHHSNIDRLWAYWQAIKPDQDIFHDSYSGQSRFASAPGTTITSKSPLQPFVGANNVVHTTESVRSIRNFGYSYLGLEYWRKSPTQMQQDATRLINQLYSSGSTKPKRAAARAETGQVKRYFARVSLDRSDVERPCDIAVFLNGTWAGGFSLMALPASGRISAGLSLDTVVHGRNGFSAMALDSAMSTMSQSIEVKVMQVRELSKTQARKELIRSLSLAGRQICFQRARFKGGIGECDSHTTGNRRPISNVLRFYTADVGYEW